MTAIIVVVTSVVLASHSRFGGVVRLENLAYDVALSIRQAQVYGISVARYQTTFSAGYGVHFDTSSLKTYVMFADVYPTATNQNGLYDHDKGELVAATDITGEYRIQKICATVNGIERCNVSKLDILFVRPEPDAWISIDGVSCVLQRANCQAVAQIIFISPRGDTRSVVVDRSGQISVSRVTP